MAASHRFWTLRLVSTLAVLSVLTLGGVGCQSNHNGSAQAAAAMEERRGGGILDSSNFDEAKDPPFTAETYFASGQLAESQGATKRAIEQYDEALKLDPKHPNSIFRLAVINTAMKQYPAAIDMWKRYVDVTGGAPTAYSNLGLCYELAGKLQDAEASYKVGIANAPKNEACHVNYGLLLAREDRRDEALAQLKTVLPPAAAHYNVASIYEQQGRFDEARQDYQMALKLDPKFADARVRLNKLPKPAAATTASR